MSQDTTCTWQSIGLDPRVSRALTKLRWAEPTPVQQAAIPYALEGKDVLAKAKTGSGKTAAYAIPIVQKILAKKEQAKGKGKKGTFALVLVPSTELAQQVTRVFQGLVHYCSQLISVLTITSDKSVEAQKPRLAEIPEILIATPGRLVQHLQRKNLSLSSLEMLVIDEADMVMSYGHKDDLLLIKPNLPNIVQGFLMSATLNPEVVELKNMILHTPVVIEVDEEEEEEQKRLKQFSVTCEDDDKFLLLYVMLKLKLVSGKTIIFVNDIARCFRLKLFLERFSIRSAVLNSELPVASRYHIVEEVNKGVINLVIATDEKTKTKPVEIKKKIITPQEFIADSEDSEDSEGSEDSEDAEGSEDSENNDDLVAAALLSDDDDEPEPVFGDDEEDVSSEEEAPKKSKAAQKNKENASEYGVSRGIDFRGIVNVVNFDCPTTPENYVHRVGRTARAGKEGLAITLVSKEDISSWEEIDKKQKEIDNAVNPYTFKVGIVEGFRYRVTDVLRSVTGKAVEEARASEIKREMLKSNKLKSHFEENPADLESLKHDDEIQSHVIKRHLAHIPDYLMPSKREIVTTLSPAGEVPDSEKNWGVAHTTKYLKRNDDPLRTFNAKRRGQKRSFSQTNAGDDGKGQMKKRRKKKDKRPDKINTGVFKPTKPKSY